MKNQSEDDADKAGLISVQFAERGTMLLELHSFLAEYWARVDRISGLPVADLYTESGSMHIGALTKEGRTEIARFFQERNEAEIKSGRNTRHFFSNIRVEWLDASRVAIFSLVVVYAAIGEFPMATNTSPATVADFKDICVHTSGGKWLIEKKTAQIIFTGANAAPFVR